MRKNRRKDVRCALDRYPKKHYRGLVRMSQAAVLNKIKKTKAALENIDDVEALRGHIFSFMNAVGRTVLASQSSVAGWAKTIKDDDGSPLWTAEQAETIEKVFSRQKGGQVKYQTDPIVERVTPYDPASFSLDESYRGVKKYLDELDERNKVLASQIGPVAMINDKKKEDYIVGPYPPVLPIPVPISPRIVLPAINTFLESLRLMVTFGPLQSDFLRMVLSITTGIFEVARGEWRNGVLSFLGVFGSWLVYAGTVGKVFRLVYGFISPDIQDRLEDDFFEGGKSLFIGFWLWLFSLTAPAFIREKLVHLHDTLVAQVDAFNEKIGTIEAAAQAQAAPLGLRVDFKRLDPGAVPSFDDIQNIQRLLRLPQIQCLDATQEVIAPLLGQPAIRLVFEMIGIVTSKEIRDEKCADIPRTFSAAVAASLKPTVRPAQTAGRRTRRNKKQSSKRKTRKH
jgi:hypothetical protein